MEWLRALYHKYYTINKLIIWTGGLEGGGERQRAVGRVRGCWEGLEGGGEGQRVLGRIRRRLGGAEGGGEGQRVVERD